MKILKAKERPANQRPEMVKVSAYLSKEEKAKLDQLCEKYEQSYSEVFRQMIRYTYEVEMKTK